MSTVLTGPGLVGGGLQLAGPTFMCDVTHMWPVISKPAGALQLALAVRSTIINMPAINCP